MEFQVIPNEQTPRVPDVDILLAHSINVHRKERQDPERCRWTRCQSVFVRWQEVHA